MLLEHYESEQDSHDYGPEESYFEGLDIFSLLIFSKASIGQGSISSSVFSNKFLSLIILFGLIYFRSLKAIL